MPITIEQAVPSDIKRLSLVFQAAFVNDRNTVIKYGHKEPNAVADMISEPLKSWIEGGKVVKAVNDAGEAVGWVCWGTKGFDQDGKRTEKNNLDLESSREAGLKVNIPFPDLTSPTVNKLTAFEDYQGAVHGAWYSILMPPLTSYFFLNTLVVDPSHQSQGVGSKLLRFVTDKADAENVAVWVSSSDGGAPAFEKSGFQEVGRLAVELDPFANGKFKGLDGKEEEWGTYTFKFLVRPSRD